MSKSEIKAAKVKDQKSGVILWNKFKDRSFSKLQNLARVIVFPIAVLPIAGIFLGVGGGFAAAAKQNGWGAGATDFFTIMQSIGNIVFANLGLLFATSVAFGFAKNSKGVAAVAGLVCFASMEITMSSLFIPSTNSAGDSVVLFDPYKLAGDYGLVSEGTNKGMLKSVIGITPTLDLSVLGGILVGWLTSIIHNRTYNIKVPKVLAFFGGEKFVPIATFLFGVAMGIVLFFVWPAILIGLYQVGSGLGSGMHAGTEDAFTSGTGAQRFGGIAISFIFGFIERILIPAGLHHVFYSPFWYTSAGGQWLEPVLNKSGVIESWTTVSGSYNIFFAQMEFVNGNHYTMTDEALKILNTLDNGKYATLYANQISGNTISYNHFTMEVGTVFSSGRFAFMQYGYPFGAAAIIMLSKKENRARTAGIIGSAGATAFLTGITEPMLFSFLFVAPLLYVFDAIMAGISFSLAYALNVNTGQGFAAGFIDYSFFGLLPGYSNGVSGATFAGRTGALWTPIYGLLIMAPSYFFGFWGIIKWKNYKTPGREDLENDVAMQAVQASLAKGTKKAASNEEQIINGLGGAENITDLDHNGKELIIKVKNSSKVNEALFVTAGFKNSSVNGKDVTITTNDAEKVWNKIDGILKANAKSSSKSIDGYTHDFLELIWEGLGGRENVDVLDNCATRLRVTVKDPEKVDDTKLKSARAIAVIKKGHSVQAIYGGEVQNIKVALEQIKHK